MHSQVHCQQKQRACRSPAVEIRDAFQQQVTASPTSGSESSWAPADQKGDGLAQAGQPCREGEE